MTLTSYRAGEMCRRSLLRLAALLPLLCPAAAHAAPVGVPTPAKGTAAIFLPGSLSKLQDMDFGMLAVTTAWTAILNANTNAITTTGGVTLVGGTPHAARFDAVSPSKHIVKISLPKQAVKLTRVNGTETMTLDTWSINGATTRNVVAHEEFQFAVAGTLHVAANQVQGIYAGTFDVTINYN